MVDFTEADRPRGILSKSDREFLLDDGGEISRQARYKRRDAIRERIQNAMVDFFLLHRELPDDELRKIFEAEESPKTSPVEDGDAAPEHNAMDAPRAFFPQIIAFIARVNDLDDAPVFTDIGRNQAALVDTMEDIEKGLTTWLAQDKRIAADVLTEVELADAKPIDELVEAAKKEGETARGLVGFQKWAAITAAVDDDELKALIEARDSELESLDEYPDGVLDEPQPEPGDDSEGDSAEDTGE